MSASGHGNIRGMSLFFDAQAMVLAAGRGERMRPLTDSTPKPLLPVRGQALMQWPMQALARGGFVRQLVNTAWLGANISDHFGDQVRWPDLPVVDVAYSHEGQDFGHALETAGGIVRALPHLAEVFWVVAGDVFAPDFVFTAQAVQRFEASPALAHLCWCPTRRTTRAATLACRPRGKCSTWPKALRLAPTPSAPWRCTRKLFLQLVACRRVTLKASRWRWPPCCAPRWTAGRSRVRCTQAAGPMWAPPSGWRN